MNYVPVALFLLSCQPVVAQGTTPFFSEYVEGSSYNKALEIYNGTGTAAPLAEYSLQRYSNGAYSPSDTLSLSGTLQPGTTLVLAHPSASTAILSVADVSSHVINHNGDDAYALLHNGSIIDVIGVIGSDPGSEWGSGNASTADNTIRRLPTVSSGEPEGFSDPSDITGQWQGFPKGTFDGLGDHSVTNGGGIDCGSQLNMIEGTVATRNISASNEDGVITSLVVASLSPVPVSGSISMGPLVSTDPAQATLTVSAEVPIGTYGVEINARRAGDPGPSEGCELTVSVVDVHPIGQIQSAGSTSPFAGRPAATIGIVTALRHQGFFVQSADDQTDDDPESSEGIYVYTGDAPMVVEGDELLVLGNVVEFYGFSEFTGAVELTVLSSGNPLPLPAVFDANTPSPMASTLHDLERFEGMRVQILRGVTTAPTDAFGAAWMVARTTRAFREPGIPFPGLPDLPVWDGNPEVFALDPDGLDLPDQDIVGGSTITAVGPLSFSYGEYRLLAQTVSVIPPQPFPQPVRDRRPFELTVGTLNHFRLIRNEPDAQGYHHRLNKLSLYLRDVMRSPDIVAVQEVESLPVLQDLANKILADDPDVFYAAYLIEGNDVAGIDVGFLVRETVEVYGVTQLQPDVIFSFGGKESLLHDRPPLLLEAAYGGSQASSFPISVVAVHNRSMSGIDDPNEGPRVRAKRFRQADMVAQAIQDLQTHDPEIHLVVLGDFNAFEFSDGHVDALGILTGVLDPTGASLAPEFDRVEPNLTNHTLLVDPEERYSFVYGGNALALDHILTSEKLGPFVQQMQFGRGNADSPASYQSDSATALRASDHDGAVLFVMTEPDHVCLSGCHRTTQTTRSAEPNPDDGDANEVARSARSQ